MSALNKILHLSRNLDTLLATQSEYDNLVSDVEDATTVASMLTATVSSSTVAFDNIELASVSGLYIYSQDGTKYSLTVQNDGSLTALAV
jgi:predicted regulator of Ras-like GTPase activity (Roadblock/LC7/MglB family)